jgi:phosphate transport system substrate-binding protein
VSITNSSGKGAYPISSFTYILVYQDTKDAVKGRALAEFLWWATHDGQAQAAPLHYAPLPSELVTRVEARLQGLTAGGKKLLEDPS